MITCPFPDWSPCTLETPVALAWQPQAPGETHALPVKTPAQDTGLAHDPLALHVSTPLP